MHVYFLHHAKRKAERFFFHLRNNVLFSGKPSIRVIYPKRFPAGKCFVAVLVPSGQLTLRAIREASTMSAKAPRIMNDRNGPCLRMLWPFPDIRQDEQARLLAEAKKKARLAENIFAMQAIISPSNGLIQARRQLRTRC